MPASSDKIPSAGTPPTDMLQGPDDSVFLTMPGLGSEPATGRLLRGLTPFLDTHQAVNVFLMTERKRREPWSDGEAPVPYQELVHWRRDAGPGTYRGVCFKGRSVTRAEVVQAFSKEPLGTIEWLAHRMEAAVISSAEPMPLAPCIVPKPWGREVWYTGIEARGVARVETATGATELPYALGMFPVPLVGTDTAAPILLKTLEPWPDDVAGDLYLELHREKWEVYVVLEVDAAAWPDGVGCLHAGLDSEKLRRYREDFGEQGEETLMRDLRTAIGAYEQVRRQLDESLDAALLQRGADPAEPVPPALRAELSAALPDSLRAREKERREAVDSFLGRIPLREGDVVCLPPGVLHSLRHGVRVVEFQTPTYERLIAMFAQKVLTQTHWDTEEALETMYKAPFQLPPVIPLAAPAGITAERVVDFPQFQVDRFALAAQAAYVGKTGGGGAYALLFVVGGDGAMVLPGGARFPLAKNAALLLPAQMGDYTLQAGAETGLTFLLAYPRAEETTARPKSVRDGVLPR